MAKDKLNDQFVRYLFGCAYSRLGGEGGYWFAKALSRFLDGKMTDLAQSSITRDPETYANHASVADIGLLTPRLTKYFERPTLGKMLRLARLLRGQENVRELSPQLIPRTPQEVTVLPSSSTIADFENKFAPLPFKPDAESLEQDQVTTLIIFYSLHKFQAVLTWGDAYWLWRDIQSSVAPRSLSLLPILEACLQRNHRPKEDEGQSGTVGPYRKFLFEHDARVYLFASHLQHVRYGDASRAGGGTYYPTIDDPVCLVVEILPEQKIINDEQKTTKEDALLGTIGV